MCWQGHSGGTLLRCYAVTRESCVIASSDSLLSPYET